jgi:hypothetical protein
MSGRSYKILSNKVNTFIAEILHALQVSEKPSNTIAEISIQQESATFDTCNIEALVDNLFDIYNQSTCVQIYRASIYNLSPKVEEMASIYIEKWVNVNEDYIDCFKDYYMISLYQNKSNQQKLRIFATYNYSVMYREIIDMFTVETIPASLLCEVQAGFIDKYRSTYNIDSAVSEFKEIFTGNFYNYACYDSAVNT